MRSPSRSQAWLIALSSIATLRCEAAHLTFHIAHTTSVAGQTESSATRNAAWSEALSSLGLFSSSQPQADIVVAQRDAPTQFDWTTRVSQGTILILEGDSPLAQSFGFKLSTESPKPAAQISVRSVVDLRSPKLDIVWQDSAQVSKFEIPKQARLFAKEKWQGAPLMAGFRQGSGAVLWLATSLGPRGYSRYPYMPQALSELGFEAPFRGSNLWAFFDSSYRSRADVDYLAPRWRKAGISALHVAAWHYWEPDPERDDYLRRLILACHRNAIQVYAWVELPHVSEKFWEDHPQWREKTALDQDAQLDWRKLMNLTNRDAFAAVSSGLRDMIGRFDWDGVNLAELYFESLEGADNPSRFTPMNDDVRREFQTANGIDPITLFDVDGKVSNPAVLRKFLDFRAELARRQQTEWMEQIELLRSGANPLKPWLDLVLTHVDDRVDTTMRDKIGADTSKTLPLLKQHDFTFLIEDPATLWDLGPQRYPQIASRYVGMTPRPEKLAIDINVVERYQDVYPTKLQTGSELFQLLHVAGQAFPRVTLYFENSILVPDLPLLAASAAQVDHAESSRDSVRTQHGAEAADLIRGASAPSDGIPVGVIGSSPGGNSSSPGTGGQSADLQRELNSSQAARDALQITTQQGVGVAWPTTQAAPAVLVDGQLWPIGNDSIQWLPPGSHKIEATNLRPKLRVLDLNAQLRSAEATSNGLEFVYESAGRALAVLDGAIATLAIDGVRAAPEMVPYLTGQNSNVLLLPPGQHLVTLTQAP